MLLGIVTHSQATHVICIMSRRMAGSSLVRVSSCSGRSLVANSLFALKETTTSLRCTTMARGMSPVHPVVDMDTMFASKAKVAQIPP
jgi:methenyltetrahydromethanopterin cyclohydrolase